MCSIHPPIILNQTEQGQMSWCKGCSSYSLVFKGCCASFSQTELSNFKNILNQLKKPDFQYTFMDEPHVILRNSKSYIGFCLTRQDVYALKKLIREAITIHEAYKIIEH